MMNKAAGVGRWEAGAHELAEKLWVCSLMDRALPCLSLEQVTTSLSGYHHILKQEK